jgi:hypothetical protein
MDVLKVLASVICICNLHVILLSKITPRYYYMFHEGDVPPVQCEASLRWSKSREDGPSHIFVDFNVPALTPRLN